eukprot:Plantae.Rhodophyta-Hildenbrandia_rubra.ctg17372.p1 GENE.Plantae.Rhodophyta-Hildenbrandia_rubra.ctg17372~~Plantae.Rhodophyta-Hildenbrandia_rubra.ctg17372.p1  ORF type:complete len:535 (-),score=97.14 Plantae.Rhodophyta-Hildenbrandia_rubra.ctg17372:1403-3007(-)
MDRPTKIDQRRTRFKKAIDPEEARRKREDHFVEIRKAKREESVMKRRRERMTPKDDMDDDLLSEMASLRAKMPDMFRLINSPDAATQLKGAKQYRKLLSIERTPPIMDVVNQGVVPIMTTFLDNDEWPDLQFESAWCLTNIASGTSKATASVINAGSVPKFVRLLSSPNANVREQAVWALGNIAGDSSTTRDLVLTNGAVEPLVTLLTQNQKLALLRNATWTLSNFCRGKPQPDFEIVKKCIPTLGHLIYFDDDDVVMDVCWAISYLSDGQNHRIQTIVESGVVKRLVQLLLSESFKVQTPALRAIGNIVTGNDSLTQYVINCSALPCLKNLLNHAKKSIRKEACWTISNITAGNKDQIQCVIESGIIPVLLDILTNEKFEVKKEACWAVSNATAAGKPEQIRYMVEQGCIEPLCNMLTAPDPRIVTVCLEGLRNIMKIGERERDQANAEYNEYARAIESVGGLDKIENLQQHSNQGVYDRAVQILETYFNAAEEEIEAVAPQESDSQMVFGTGNGGDPAPNGGFNFDMQSAMQ